MPLLSCVRSLRRAYQVVDCRVLGRRAIDDEPPAGIALAVFEIDLHPLRSTVIDGETGTHQRALRPLADRPIAVQADDRVGAVMDTEGASLHIELQPCALKGGCNCAVQ